MRIAGSSLLRSNESFATACRRLEALGFDAVDVGAMAGWAHVEPAAIAADRHAVAETIRSGCGAAGLDPVAFNASAGTDDPVEERDRLLALAELAADLDAAVITIQGRSTDAPLEDDIERCRQLASALADRDVTVAIETHWGTHLEDPAVASRYAAIDGLGLTLDPSHYVIGGYGFDAYEPLLPAVEHVHLRQARDGWDEVQMPVDDGHVDVEGLLDALGEGGYDGIVSVEYIDSVGDVEPAWVEEQARGMRERIEAALA